MKLKLIILIVIGILSLAVVAFIVTTNLNSPKAFKMNVPASENEEKINYNEDSTISILILNNDEFICYKKDLNKNKLSLLKVREYLIKEDIAKKDFTVIIKSVSTKSYKAVVDILDEMQINNIKKYAVVDVTEEEKAFLKLLK